MATQSAPEVFAVLKRYGIRQKDLAGTFDVSEAIISMWARGIKPVPEYRLHDLWALAYLARNAIIAGGSGRDVLLRWSPTGLVWQTSEGHEAFTQVWEKWDRPTFQRLLMQPGGDASITLHDATADLPTYVDRVVAAELAGTPPSADDLEILRHMCEMARAQIFQLQEMWAKQPLPMPTPQEEPERVDEAAEGGSVSGAPGEQRVDQPVL
jgi:hypothetical protein